MGRCLALCAVVLMGKMYVICVTAYAWPVAPAIQDQHVNTAPFWLYLCLLHTSTRSINSKHKKRGTMHLTCIGAHVHWDLHSDTKQHRLHSRYDHACVRMYVHTYHTRIHMHAHTQVFRQRVHRDSIHTAQPQSHLKTQPQHTVCMYACIA